MIPHFGEIYQSIYSRENRLTFLTFAIPVPYTHSIQTEFRQTVHMRSGGGGGWKYKQHRFIFKTLSFGFDYLISSVL